MLAGLTYFATGFSYNTINYTAKNGILSNSVRKIFIDNTHRVWIGTDNGVSCMTGNGIVNYIYSHGLTHHRIWEIVQTPDSTLWFGSHGRGLYRFRNNRFTHFPLPESSGGENNAIRKIKSFGSYLYIGSKQGPSIFDPATGKYIPFRNETFNYRGQILDFFEYKTKLYFLTHQDGTFEINPTQKSVKRIRFNTWESIYGYSAYTFNDSIYIARTHFNKNEPHNLLRWQTDDYLTGVKPDSVEVQTVIWEFTHTPSNEMYMVCYGVHDESGGLYKLAGNKTVRMNEAMGIESNKLWDIKFDSVTNKLYIASLDKGLYVVDFNRVAAPNRYFSNSDILDVKISGKKVFVMTHNAVSLIEDNAVVKTISLNEIKKWLNRTRPKLYIDDFESNTLDQLSDMSISENYLAINSNFAAIRLDHNLNLVDYMKVNVGGKIVFLSNNAVLRTHNYGRLRMFDEFGKNEIEILNSPSNRGKILYGGQTEFTMVNDTTYLSLGTIRNLTYLFKQNSRELKEYLKLGNLHQPLKTDFLAENEIIAADKANQLYRMTYANDTLTATPFADLKKWGVIEVYFVKASGKIIVAGTNKGLVVFDDNKTFVVNESFGLPRNTVLRTAGILNKTVWLATSEGLFTIDINRLRQVKTDYTLTNLTVEADSLNIPYRLSEKITFNQYPHEILIQWEMNAHPYPEKIKYSYSIGDDSTWMDVQAGRIRYVDPAYGETPVYLRMADATNGQVKTVHLLTVFIKKPFYMQAWLYVLTGMIFMTMVFFFFYNNRVKIMNRKTEKAEKEASELQLRLDTLQFLLKPHFIFNALSSVQNLMLKNEIHKSIEYTGYFAKFLRGIMQQTDERLITLSREIDNTLRYIELEKLRFNTNVEVNIDISDEVDAESFLIIPFLFQPLIENMFKHAFTPEIEKPTIDIAVTRNKTAAVFRISDNGTGLHEQTPADILTKTNSKGLKITQAQLRKHFPEKHIITLNERAEGGLCWVIVIEE